MLFDKLGDINRKITDHELRLAEVEEITKDLERSLTVTQDIEDEKIKNNEKKIKKIEEKMTALKNDIIKSCQETTPGPFRC